MQPIAFPYPGTGAGGAERRRDPRYDVELYGELRHGGGSFSVLIADISGSGALVFMENPPQPGSDAQLWIEDFGVVPIKIIHVGQYFCGVAIAQPERHRARLLEWLQGEIAAGGPAAAVR